MATERKPGPCMTRMAWCWYEGAMQASGLCRDQRRSDGRQATYMGRACTWGAPCIGWRGIAGAVAEEVAKRWQNRGRREAEPGQKQLQKMIADLGDTFMWQEGMLRQTDTAAGERRSCDRDSLRRALQARNVSGL